MPTIADRQRSNLTPQAQDLLIKHILKYFENGAFVQHMKAVEPFAGCIAAHAYSELDLRNTRESLRLSGHLVAIGKGRGTKMKTTQRGTELVRKLPYPNMEK